MEAEKLPSKYGGVGKVAAASALILLLSIGLCGFSLSHMQNEPLQSLGVISMLGMGVGVLGLLGSLLAAVFMFFAKD